MLRAPILAPVLFLLFLADAGRAGDRLALEQPPTHPQARQYRKRGRANWAAAKPVWDKLGARKEVTPEEAAQAVKSIEIAVLDLERSLALEWEKETNKDLAACVRAWFKLYPLVPPPPEPADDEAREKAEKAAKKVRLERLRGARRFVMDYGKARRFEKLFGRCPRCDGRKIIRAPFGGERACTNCKKRGLLVHRKGMLAARWMVHSPLYRADGRNSSKVNRLLHTANGQPQLAGPFVRSVSILGDIEDNDTWMRVRAREKTYRTQGAKRTETAEEEYIIYRVGKQWYLYSPRFDRDLLGIESEE